MNYSSAIKSHLPHAPTALGTSTVLSPARPPPYINRTANCSPALLIRSHGFIGLMLGEIPAAAEARNRNGERMMTLGKLCALLGRMEPSLLGGKRSVETGAAGLLGLSVVGLERAA